MPGVGRVWFAPPNPHNAPTKENHMKRLITMMLLGLFSMGTLTACNTMAGAGEDVQEAGEAIEGQAKDCDAGDC